MHVRPHALRIENWGALTTRPTQLHNTVSCLRFMRVNGRAIEWVLKIFLEFNSILFLHEDCLPTCPGLNLFFLVRLRSRGMYSQEQNEFTNASSSSCCSHPTRGRHMFLLPFPSISRNLSYRLTHVIFHTHNTSIYFSAYHYFSNHKLSF